MTLRALMRVKLQVTQTTVFLHVASYIIPFLDIFIPKVGLNRWVLLARLSAVTLAQSEHKGGKGISIAHTVHAQKCQPATHIAASVLFSDLHCCLFSQSEQRRKSTTEDKDWLQEAAGHLRPPGTSIPLAPSSTWNLQELQELQEVAGGCWSPTGWLVTWVSLLLGNPV